MKTPQEWLEEMKARPCVTENDLIAIINHIQDDARKDARNSARASFLDQALNEGDGVYRP